MMMDDGDDDDNDNDDENDDDDDDNNQIWCEAPVYLAMSRHSLGSWARLALGPGTPSWGGSW